MKRSRLLFSAMLTASLGLFGTAALADDHTNLPDPDGQEADMSKPVQVFLIMGQSNTLENGVVKGGKDPQATLTHAVEEEGLYPFLVDDEGNWTTRKDVKNVSVMMKRGKRDIYRNDWLTISGGKIGIEIGVGHHLGEALDAPVLVLKSSIGNRALGWDLLPPGSEQWEFEDGGKTWVYAGYKDTAEKWEKGAEPQAVNWYAGKQYDDDVANAKYILDNLDEYYPGAKSWELAGIVWWQGDRDMRDAGHSARYEQNLANLIAALRNDFNAPEAKFVLATLGQVEKDSASGNLKTQFDGMMNISDPKKHPDLAGDVATVYAHPLSKGSSSSAHYGGNAQTYMNVGLALGHAMADLIKAED